jgi:hypothetical protein
MEGKDPMRQFPDRDHRNLGSTAGEARRSEICGRDHGHLENGVTALWNATWLARTLFCLIVQTCLVFACGLGI